MSKKRLFRQILALITVLLLTLSTVSTAFAETTSTTVNPKTVYAQINGVTVAIDFQQLWDAYANDNTAYQTTWKSAKILGIVMPDGTTLAWDAFWDALAANEVQTVVDYANKTGHVAYTVPTQCAVVDANGVVGAVGHNPNVPVELAVSSVNAIGVKKLQVNFNLAVDTTKATVALTKGSISVNTSKVEFAADKLSAVITTTTNLTQGEYTVTVSGLTTTALTGKVTVQNEKVAKIVLTSDVAARLSGNKTALVSYQVLNQYGEKMVGQTINWTVSTGVPTSSDTNTTGDGTFVITAANSLDFVPGAVVYITGVHGTTGTVVNGQVSVVLNAQADKVVFKGVYDKTNAKLVTLPAGFTASNYDLLYEVLDQYGNKIANPTFSDLVFLSNNPLFVGTPTSADTDVTIDSVNYEAVVLPQGTAVDNGGTVTIQAISKLTGTTASFTTSADALAALKSFTMSAPAKMIAEGERVEIPFTALDQYGNAVTKYSKLYNATTPIVSLSTGLAFVQQDDGTAKLYYTAPGTGAEPTTDLLVYATSLVPNGGSFSSLMLTVRDAAVPTAIVGVDAAKTTSVAKGNYVDLKAQDLIVQDQYGRTMTDTAVNTWINTGTNSIVVTSTYASGDTTPFTVKLNNTGSDAAAQVLEGSTDYVRVAAKTGTTTATENLSFALSTDSGSTSSALSTKAVAFAKVLQSAYTSYTVTDFTTMWNDAAATTATPDANYNKVVKVYGVMADGTKVLLPYTDYTVTTDGKLAVSNNGQNATLSDVTSSGYATGDFADASGDYANVNVTVLVTVNDASGAAAAILSKPLAVSSKTPKVATVTLDEDYVTDGKAIINPAAGAINATLLNSFIYEVDDQYGVVDTEAPSITITNLTKGATSTFTVTGNATSTVAISGATMGDKFTATYKFASGVTATVDFTVGLNQ